MKFVVQVGEDFPIHAVEESAQANSQLTVNVNQIQSSSEPRTFNGPKLSISTWFVLALCGLALLAATTYGCATGDYSVLKDLAASAKSLLASGTKAMEPL